MRNLLLIHLESLNYLNYRVNPEMFPNLYMLEKKSLTFSNYFSSATSTIMVIGDLLYGGMMQYEMCNSMDNIPSKYCYEDSLFDQLENEGYKTGVFYYPGSFDSISAEKKHVAGFRSEMISFDSYKDYIEEIKAIIDSGKLFAVLLCNTVNNLALNHKIEYGDLESGIERWKDGYQFIDNYVKNIIDLLDNKQLLDKTTIVCYGDHGDDYYSHGYHGGLTHAIEPYANLIHAPLWIFDNRLEKNGRCNELISTVDIRSLCIAILKIKKGKISWEELGVKKRKYIMARNAYAAQPVRLDTFNKAYCLSDGKFMLVVSSKGLEFYYLLMDLECQNNLLKLFIYKDELLLSNEELIQGLDYHYKFLFDIGTMRQIRQKFYYLKNKLYVDTKKLFLCADCESKFNELDFENINYD